MVQGFQGPMALGKVAWAEPRLSSNSVWDVQPSSLTKATAAALSRTDCIPDLEDRLADPDTRVAYNALWAMQKLHALPPAWLLKSLYYRAPDGILRTRLGFLSGLVAGEPPARGMFEIETGIPVRPGEIRQILSHGEPLPDHEVTVMQENQALHVDRTNIFGFVFW